MKRWVGFAAVLAALVSVEAQAQSAAKPAPKPEYDIYPFEDRALDPLTWPELQRFSGEADFKRYLRQLDAIRNKRERRWVMAETGVRLASAGPVEADQMPCDPAVQECPEAMQDVVVTAQKATSPAASVSVAITNVQTANVDEGDIVKQIGHYLITLQDGRLIVVDMAGNRLTDRFDVYRRDEDGDPVGADWYDEMLVQDDHVLVAAYSYEDSATELSVFRLDQASGKIARIGVFLISSDDYYSARNYATRIVGDKLVLYSPIDAEDLRDRANRPVIRRWLPEKERAAAQAEGKPLLAAEEIWKPVLRTGSPRVHTLSVCPLGGIGTGAMLECRATALVAPGHGEMYVSPNAIYLWTTAWRESYNWNKPDCTAKQMADAPSARDTVPGAIYRIPFDGKAPTLVSARGGPGDQFAMDEEGGRFRALAITSNFRCNREDIGPVSFTLYQPAPDEFGDLYAPEHPASGRAVPSLTASYVQQRFAGDWLVYGGRRGWTGFPPSDVGYDDDEDVKPEFGNIVAVPLKRPGDAQVIPVDHSVLRLERVGAERLVATGYHDAAGLEFTLLGLGKTARIVGRATLPNRFESEGRSHAFNATSKADGSGILAIPTVEDKEGNGRWWWRSQASDLSFLTMDKAGALRSAGELVATTADEVTVAKGYTCEVSCIDWYGNSRPIFTGGRIYGLLGTQLVEAEMDDGKIDEIERLDLTGPVGTKAANAFAKPEPTR